MLTSFSMDFLLSVRINVIKALMASNQYFFFTNDCSIDCVHLLLQFRDHVKTNIKSARNRDKISKS
jgi:hypothetical protein